MLVILLVIVKAGKSTSSASFDGTRGFEMIMDYIRGYGLEKAEYGPPDVATGIS